MKPSQISFILYKTTTFNLVKTEDSWVGVFFSPRALTQLGVGVGSLLLSEGGHNVHKAPVVLNAAFGTPSLLFLLLLLVNLEKENKQKNISINFLLITVTFPREWKNRTLYLRSLSSYFSSTGKRTVHLTWKRWHTFSVWLSTINVLKIKMM